jgi:multiple sugar transport system permease protein
VKAMAQVTVTADQLKARGTLVVRRRIRWVPILFVLPAIAFLLAITIFPLLVDLWLMFQSWELTTSFPPHFVGLQNFTDILTQDPRFWNAMENTGILVVLGVGIQVVLGVGLALLLNQVGRTRTWLVSLLLIPVLIAPVVAGFQFRMIYNDQNGPLNYLLQLISGGLIRGYAWLADPKIALYSIMITDIWQWTPFMILIVLAGLQSIPIELNEAAEMDGASTWQRFWRITLPLLLPVIIIGILIRLMDAFKLFDIIYQLTGGGPGSLTETIAFYTYLQGFKFFSLGYTAAMSVIQLIVIIIVSQIFLGYQKRQRGEVLA